MPRMKEVGNVSHYYTNIGVAVVELTAPLKVGDQIRIMGYHTDFEQRVKSMEIEHGKVEEAGSGDSIGIKVKDRVRENDKVYLITPL